MLLMDRTLNGETMSIPEACVVVYGAVGGRHGDLSGRATRPLRYVEGAGMMISDRDLSRLLWELQHMSNAELQRMRAFFVVKEKPALVQVIDRIVEHRRIDTYKYWVV